MTLPCNQAAGKIVIIGVGNLLLKDEGVGVHVAQELQKKDLPSAVEVHDGGVAGIGLLDFFQGASKVLLIDAADMNLDAGAVVRFTPEEVAGKIDGPRFSAHEVGVLEILDLARALDQYPPEVVIFGIQPKEIAWGTELSPEVQASIPKAVEAVWEEIDAGNC
jgi:hydrogenase maturation protease